MSSSVDVHLRTVVDSDLPILFEHQREPDANRMADFGARDHDAFMAHWNKILNDESVTARTVVVDDRVAGNLVSWMLREKRQLGYWIGKEFWGKGVATQAVGQFLDVVSDRPLYAEVVRSNIASARVLEKCGFKRTTVCDPDDPDSLDVFEEFILR